MDNDVSIVCMYMCIIIHCRSDDIYPGFIDPQQQLYSQIERFGPEVFISIS